MFHCILRNSLFWRLNPTGTYCRKPTHLVCRWCIRKTHYIWCVHFHVHSYYYLFVNMFMSFIIVVSFRKVRKRGKNYRQFLSKRQKNEKKIIQTKQSELRKWSNTVWISTCLHNLYCYDKRTTRTYTYYAFWKRQGNQIEPGTPITCMYHTYGWYTYTYKH